MAGRVLVTAMAWDNGKPRRELIRKLAEIPLKSNNPHVLLRDYEMFRDKVEGKPKPART